MLHGCKGARTKVEPSLYRKFQQIGCSRLDAAYEGLLAERRMEKMRRAWAQVCSAAALAFGIATSASLAQAPVPTARAPYTLTLFAGAPAGMSAPDSIA